MHICLCVCVCIYACVCIYVLRLVKINGDDDKRTKLLISKSGLNNVSGGLTRGTIQLCH